MNSPTANVVDLPKLKTPEQLFAELDEVLKDLKLVADNAILKMVDDFSGRAVELLGILHDSEGDLSDAQAKRMKSEPETVYRAYVGGYRALIDKTLIMAKFSPDRNKKTSHIHSVETALAKISEDPGSKRYIELARKCLLSIERNGKNH
jgi:hypothetical protein